MSAKEMAELVGKVGQWKVDGTEAMTVPVEVEDARTVFGRTDVKICPVGGQGGRWVELSSVVMDGQSSNNTTAKGRRK